jgi:hypothetical protein
MASAISTYSIHETADFSQLRSLFSDTGIMTQRLAKRELSGVNGDALADEIDELIVRLKTRSKRSLAANQYDCAGAADMIGAKWEEMKRFLPRDGLDSANFIRLSEDVYFLTERAVSAINSMSDKHVNDVKRYMMVIDVLVIIWAMAHTATFVASFAKKKTADKPAGRKEIPDRCDCEKALGIYRKNPEDRPLCVMIFRISDADDQSDFAYDRKAGDFGFMLMDMAAPGVSVWRYSRDEFLATLPVASQSEADKYLTDMNVKVVSYNLLHINMSERINFFAGCAFGNPADKRIDEIIDEAERMACLDDESVRDGFAQDQR